MRVGFVIGACLLFAATAWAEYPLVVTQEIQMPTNGPWDVQHVTSDSTFGYAYIANDSVYWAENVGEVENALGIAEIRTALLDSVWLGGSLFCGYQRIQLLRLPSQGNDLCALIQTEYEDCYGEFNRYFLIFIINLETESTAGYILRNSVITSDYHIAWSVSTYMLLRPIMWPMLPEITSTAVFGVLCTRTVDAIQNYHETTHSEATDVFTFHDNRISCSTVADAAVVSLFANDDVRTHFTLGGKYSHHWYDDDGSGDTIRYWITTYALGSTVGTQFDYPTSNVIAQVDSDGTQRIIAEGMTALDPNNYTMLWTIPEAADTFYSVRMFESDDEQIFAFQSGSHRFRVYDASNGILLGETSPIVGDIAYVLKPSGFSHEIVTWEVATLTIRVYTSQPPAMDGLTIAYLPESNMLRLSWPEVSGASGYKIYAAPAMEGPWEWIVGLPSGRTVYHVPAHDSLRFFQVTAEYDE